MKVRSLFEVRTSTNSEKSRHHKLTTTYDPTLIWLRTQVESLTRNWPDPSKKIFSRIQSEITRKLHLLERQPPYRLESTLGKNQGLCRFLRITQNEWNPLLLHLSSRKEDPWASPLFSPHENPNWNPCWNTYTLKFLLPFHGTRFILGSRWTIINRDKGVFCLVQFRLLCLLGPLLLYLCSFFFIKVKNLPCLSSKGK